MERYFIQHAFGDSYAPLRKLSEDWHRQYAKAHGLKYLITSDYVSTGKCSVNSMGVFNFFRFLYEISEGDEVMQIDIDAIIVKPHADILGKLEGKYDLGQMGKQWFRSGCLLIAKKGPALMKAWKHTVEHGPLTATNYEVDPTLNHYVREAEERGELKSLVLNDAYNWYDLYGAGKVRMDTPRKDAIILHCRPGNPHYMREEYMKAALTEVKESL